MSLFDQIKRADSSGKVLYGIKDSEKSLLVDNPLYVIFSSDIEDISKERLLHLLKLSNVKYLEVKNTYKELGSLVGKDFPVGAITILDKGNSNIEKEMKV